MIRSRITTTIVLAAVLGAAPARAAEGPRVAVMNITAEQGIDLGPVRLLNELLLTELNEAGAFGNVIGERDIAAMLTLEEERAKITGCVDESCLAEIGGALGVEYMFSSNVGRMGEKYVLNAKLLDVKRATVTSRGSEVVPADDEAALIDAMKRLVKRIVGKVDEAAGGGANVAGWTTAAVAAACLIGGAVSGGLALRGQGELDDMERLDPDLADVEDRVWAEAVAADVLLAVGGALAVTSVVLFLVLGRGEQAPAGEGGVSVAPLLGEHGAGAAVRWSF